MSAIVPDNCGNKWRLFLQVAVIKSAAVFKNNALTFYYIDGIACYTRDCKQKSPPTSVLLQESS